MAAHHFVPQLLLRRFSHDGVHLNFMEKGTRRIFGGTVAKSFSLKDFHRIAPDGLPQFDDLAEEQLVRKRDFRCALTAAAPLNRPRIGSD
ncbi:DUF4238 domain-containing protein, partial [Rhizobium hidalgonense]